MDFLLEGILHHSCAFLLSIRAIGVVSLSIRMLWLLTRSKDANVLILSALYYNRGIPNSPKLPTRFRFDFKEVTRIFAIGIVGILADGIAGAVSWVSLKGTSGEVYENRKPGLDFSSCMLQKHSKSTCSSDTRPLSPVGHYVRGHLPSFRSCLDPRRRAITQ